MKLVRDDLVYHIEKLLNIEDDEFRASARMNEEQSQKRDSDFG